MTTEATTTEPVTTEPTTEPAATEPTPEPEPEPIAATEEVLEDSDKENPEPATAAVKKPKKLRPRKNAAKVVAQAKNLFSFGKKPEIKQPEDIEQAPDEVLVAVIVVAKREGAEAPAGLVERLSVRRSPATPAEARHAAAAR